MTAPHERPLGRRFDEIPDLYDRVRPGYPPELHADLAQITGLSQASSVLEVGCGAGQATQALAGIAGSVTAVEPGWIPLSADRGRTPSCAGRLPSVVT